MASPTPSAQREHFELLLDTFLATSAPDSLQAKLASRAAEQLLTDFGSAVERWRESEQTTASRFNLLEVMQVADRETIHSRVLAWLLADDLTGLGTHAQGALGFRAFLQEMGLPESYGHHAGRYWVRTEARGRESIIDIEVGCKRSFLIHIENKIWADEGEDQTVCEWRDLDRLAGELEVPAACIHAYFLTLDGRAPKERRFAPVRWTRIAEVFDRFCEAAKAPQVKMFCSHYARSLREMSSNVLHREVRNGAPTLK